MSAVQIRYRPPSTLLIRRHFPKVTPVSFLRSGSQTKSNFSEVQDLCVLQMIRREAGPDPLRHGSRCVAGNLRDPLDGRGCDRQGACGTSGVYVTLPTTGILSKCDPAATKVRAAKRLTTVRSCRSGATKSLNVKTRARWQDGALQAPDGIRHHGPPSHFRRRAEPHARLVYFASLIDV